MMSQSQNPEDFLQPGSSYLTPINLSEFQQLKCKLLNKYFHEKHIKSKQPGYTGSTFEIDKDDNLLRELFSRSYNPRHQMTKMTFIANYRKTVPEEKL